MLLCNQIFILFSNLKGNRDSLLYQGHHYLEPDDVKDILEYSELILAHSKVKKMYVLYLDSFKDFKREVLNSLNIDGFKELITEKSFTLKEFKTTLRNHEFKERILYEILREKYY